MSGPTIVPFTGGSLADVAGSMEKAAADIRASQGAPVLSAACVTIDENGEVAVYGWGRTDDIQSIGLLHLGAAWLSNHKVGQ